jgi:multicomponent Na+:H+ antiporter subunit F
MSYYNLVYELFTSCIIVLSICTLACLIRTIKGPSIADRLIAINMTDTEVVALICLLAARSGEYGFTDIAIIYSLFSFLAVAILTRFLAGRRKP